MPTTDRDRTDIGAFDYVIIGAGSAGAVIASRLTEDPNIRVCVLEAGPKDKSALIHMPSGFAFMSPNSPLNWRFDTLPQKHLNNRICYQPRGRGLGGSSSINAMIYIRGSRADYQRWESHGATGWGWDDVLPYFKKAEDNCRGADDYHGVGGPLTVSELRYRNPLSEQFIDATAELQLRPNDDFNGADQEGFGFYQVTQRDGQRCSSARAYLHPAMERENLTILTDAHVERVLIENKKANGVAFRMGDGAAAQLTANREVIICAGAFQSPQILQLSGIGPGAHLTEHGVEVIHDAPMVGENLQDHLDWTAIHNSNSSYAFGLFSPFLGRLLNGVLQYNTKRQGILTSNLAECGGFYKTDPTEDETDLQLHFLPAKVDDHGRKRHLKAGLSCHVCVLRPKSRGSVRLQSGDPFAPPAIDPNFLSDTDDLHRLMKGARLVERILAAPAMASVVGERLYLPEGASDDALEADIRARSDTIYHPVGTCAIGSVVDPSLRVHGVDGLRVADASVMPFLISGNTNAPSIMIGERAADFIRAA